MTGRFGKYGEAKRKLKMRKTRRQERTDLQKIGGRRCYKGSRPARRRNV